MFRIDDASAATSLPAPEAAGTEGYWTEGNPATGVAATLERASWFNMIQEELRNVVTAGGQIPAKTNYGQLLAALRAMYGSGRVGHAFTANDWVPLPGGLILQWGLGSSAANSAGGLVPFPIAFPNSCLHVVATDTLSSFYIYGCGVLTANSFYLFCQSANGVWQPGIAHWFAIGY